MKIRDPISNFFLRFIPARKVREYIKFRVNERSDFLDAARELVQGIDEKFLRNRHNPVVIAMEGSISGGKTAIRDVALYELMGNPEECFFNGTPSTRERWGKKREDGSFLEIGFLNGRSSKIGKYFRSRKHGGIAFLSNGDEKGFPRKNADIGIYTSDAYISWGEQQSIDREVVIEIRGKRLLSTPRLRAAFDKIRAQCDEKGIYRAKTPVPRYPMITYPPYNLHSKWK